MALTTQSIPTESTEKSNHDGYEFIKDSEGRISLKKIRSKKLTNKKIKVEKVEKVETVIKESSKEE